MATEVDPKLITQIADDMTVNAPFNAYADLIPDDTDTAYDIQDQVIATLIDRKTRGPLCGHKLALNSAKLMQMMGVDEPSAGQMFSDQKWQSGVNLNRADYRSLLIEVEILAVMGRDLPPVDGGHKRQDAEAAIARYLPAIELVDSRDRDIADARRASMIAQNINFAGVIIGGAGLTPQELDVAELPVTLSFDDVVAAQTKGTAPQHPGDAVAWMANHLNKRGRKVLAGDIIICGTHFMPPPIGKARHVLGDMGPLGKVEFTIS